MQKLAAIFTGLVAIIHVYIMILETMLWTTRGLNVFGMQFSED